MGDIGIIETAQYMANGINFANIGQIDCQTLPLTHLSPDQQYQQILNDGIIFGNLPGKLSRRKSGMATRQYLDQSYKRDNWPIAQIHSLAH